MENLKGFSFDLLGRFVNIGFIRHKGQIAVGLGVEWDDSFFEFYVELLFINFCISIDFLLDK